MRTCDIAGFSEDVEAYWTDQQGALYVGDAGAVLARLPAESVQSVITSPPYFGLRDYAGHPDQIGREPTPEQYVEAVRRVFGELARVLRADGTVWLNLRDTYSGSANAGRSADRHTGRGHRRGVAATRVNTTTTAPLKSLLLIPSRVGLALQADGWVVRNDVIWHKPNAMPESVTDRLAVTYEHLFLLTRNTRYYFNLDAIRRYCEGTRRDRTWSQRRDAGAPVRKGLDPQAAAGDAGFQAHPLGSNPGDVWTIATRPSRQPHWAMFPIDLPIRCITASSQPGDLVLHPFSGAGTTAVAAKALGRHYLGIDLHAAYHDLAIAQLEQTLTFG